MSNNFHKKILTISVTNDDTIDLLIKERPTEIHIYGGGGFFSAALAVIKFCSEQGIKIVVHFAHSAGVAYVLAKDADLTECLEIQTHGTGTRQTAIKCSVENLRIFLMTYKAYEPYIDQNRLTVLAGIWRDEFISKEIAYWEDIHPSEKWLLITDALLKV